MFNISQYERNSIEAFRKANNEFGRYSDSDCIKLDEGISKISDKIIQERKKILENRGDKLYTESLERVKGGLESSFIFNNCRDKIEQKRAIESGKLITKQAIEQEKSILKKNEGEQFIYIGLGSLVLLVGLYLIVKK
jgi:hypothetical protein